jgi:CheY-like chemotaxis protein
MIQRVGEAEVVSGTGPLVTWRVPLNEVPSPAWRHNFLERARTVWLCFDTSIWIEDAALIFELEETCLRIGLARIDAWIGDTNADCGDAAPEAGSPSAPDTTILVVDDEAEVRALTCAVLKQAGFTVLDTGDPRKALRMAQTKSIRLLLTDVTMPVLNGCELAERLESFSPETEVLFMSGDAGPALPPGTPFIAKPFTVEGLVRRVRDALSPPVRRPGGDG